MHTKKPLRVFIYLPLHIKNGTGSKFARYLPPKAMGYFPVKKGDIVDLQKRGGVDEKFTSTHEHTVETVKYNITENACIAVLEPKVFADEKAIARFINRN